MAVTAGALIAEGSRVRIRRGSMPMDSALLGRTGTVIDNSEYRAHSYGVLLDGETSVRFFRPEEMEVMAEAALPPADREDAKRRRALP